MKNIEIKLKEDAMAFKQKPSDSRLRNIMKNIQDINTANKTKSPNKFHRWMIPVGVSVAALLFVVLNLTKPLEEKYPVETIVAVNEKIQLINIDGLSLAFESQMMNAITLEKQALQKDLDYIHSLFVL